MAESRSEKRDRIARTPTKDLYGSDRIERSRTDDYLRRSGQRGEQLTLPHTDIQQRPD